MGIGYQLLLEVFKAETPLFGPVLTSDFALWALGSGRDWLGLGLEVPAKGRDWMALGLGSAGHRPGLKLEFPA